MKVISDNDRHNQAGSIARFLLDTLSVFSDKHRLLIFDTIREHYDVKTGAPLVARTKFMGSVVDWNRDGCWAKVTLDDGRSQFVHSSSYHSPSDDWPRVGARVEVVFNTAGDYLSTHEVPR